MGEFHISRRAPNGIPGPHFRPNGKPDMYCLWCMAQINENHIEMWADLSEGGECVDCQQIRCWRYDECECDCHSGVTEEDTDEGDE
jgi:hypothetical protein